MRRPNGWVGSSVHLAKHLTEMKSDLEKLARELEAKAEALDVDTMFVRFQGDVLGRESRRERAKAYRDAAAMVRAAAERDEQ